MSDPVQSVTQRLVALALDAHALRHKVIANNVANIDTENYRPLQVDFESKLAALQSASQAGAPDGDLNQLLDQVKPTVAYRDAGVGGRDVSSRLDDEMLAMVQNTMDYESTLTAMQRLGDLTRIAIGDQ